MSVGKIPDKIASVDNMPAQFRTGRKKVPLMLIGAEEKVS